jgi:sulfhydrogenase subunit beta (sulfur reductase)
LRFDRDGTPVATEPDETRRAFVGVRSCDLHGIMVQDQVLATRGFTDPDYAVRRRNTFIVAVACGSPAQTCFCVSMGTGPAPDAGFDLALTEVVDVDGHRFVADVGTDAGASMLARVPTRTAATADEHAAGLVVDGAVARMQRAVDTTDIRDLLYDNVEHPRWDDVARRCLSCTNCTLVCPTCFCTTTEDVADLTQPVGRDRVWDSCFNAEHSRLHGGPVRDSTRSRYRQWATHKFASWIDQFGTSGCVGCGRCIAWCPAGIDITEELAAIRATATDKEGRS